MEDVTTRWPDPGIEGFRITLASFAESPGRTAVVVTGPTRLPSGQEAALAEAGFSRMAGKGTVWARPGGAFKMRELRRAFPLMAARVMPVPATRLLVRGPCPFEMAAEAKGTVRLHADAPNVFQVPYVPASKLGTPVAMVPVNLAESTQSALARVTATHGDVDSFVAARLDMTVHELARALSPEQVDAVAVMLDAIDRGRAPILADQTGLGKGRVVAALMLAAAVAGRPVVFITEKANLFSDIWRDVTDIGAAARLGTPFLLNSKSRIVDVTSDDGKVLFDAWKDADIARVVKSGKLPEGASLLFATYSQFNRMGSAKAEFLASVSKGALVLQDETHNAGGDSNQQKVIDAATAPAAAVVRSSATFARRASGLLAYRGVLPPSLAVDDSAEMLAAGGTELAEALSQYLCEDGVLVRREHDLSGLSINVVVDSGRRDRNRAMADSLAPVLARMAKLSRMVDDEIETRNEEAERQGGKASREKWYAANFGSRLSSLVRHFVTALSVDLCVDRCVAALVAGEKPVVVIESTMESLMRELASDGDAQSDEASDDEGAVEGAKPPDFRAALSTMVDRIMHMSVRRGRDDPEKVPVEDPFCVAEAEAVRRLIEAFPDLSLSPIDDIRDRIEEEGRRLHASGEIPAPWKADEISARKMRVRGGVYETMKAQDRNATIVGFNGGALDALVITRAASTGLSLHASEKVRDRRRRRMIELQIPSNVVERVQFWGRVNRRGQVSVPGFETLCTGLPLQMRILAMENRKVASLSANVSANAENASAMDVPDIIDSVGNEAARRILEDRPRLAERMCIAMRVDPETAEQELYHVNKLLQRLCLLPSDEQDEVFAQLVSDYEDLLAALRASGKTPRGVRELDGVWRVISREPYEPGCAADGTVFGRPVDLVRMEATIEKEPMGSQQVSAMIAASRARLASACGKAAGPFFEDERKEIKSSRRKVLNAALAGRFISSDSALASPGPNAVKAAAARITWLMDTLAYIQPGGTMTVPGDEGEPRMATILDVRAPGEGENHLPGRWAVRFAAPGDTSPREVSLATIMRDRQYDVHRIRPGMLPDSGHSHFDLAPRGKVREVRTFLDGNLVKAVAIAAECQAGSMVTYTDESGRRRRSVLVSRRGMKALADRSMKADTPDEAISLMRSGRALFSRPAARATGLVISADGKGFLVQVPRGKEGKALEEGPLKELGLDFRPVRDHRAARLTASDAPAAIAALLSAGFPLHYDSGSRPASPPPPDRHGHGRPQAFRPGR